VTCQIDNGNVREAPIRPAAQCIHNARESCPMRTRSGILPFAMVTASSPSHGAHDLVWRGGLKIGAKMALFLRQGSFRLHSLSVGSVRCLRAWKRVACEAG